MGIHGLDEVSPEGAMGDQDGIPPAGTGHAGIDDEAVGDRKDRVAEVAIHTANAIDIISGMTSAPPLIQFPE